MSENSSEIKGQNQTLKSVIPIKLIPSGPKQSKEKRKKEKTGMDGAPSSGFFKQRINLGIQMNVETIILMLWLCIYISHLS